MKRRTWRCSDGHHYLTTIEHPDDPQPGPAAAARCPFVVDGQPCGLPIHEETSP